MSGKLGLLAALSKSSMEIANAEEEEDPMSWRVFLTISEFQNMVIR
jgi:hypothetical protein